jgi:hypothetical protein
MNVQKNYRKTLYLAAHFALVALLAAGLLLVPAFNSTGTVAAQDQDGAQQQVTPDMLSYALNFNNLKNAYSAMNQLPCTQVKETDLTGRTYAPGVYCLSSASLAGEMTLDGANNVSSIFIFRVEGSFSAKSGASLAFANKAMGSNVYFVSKGSATVAAGSDLKANILANDSVKVEGGAMLRGRALSLKGKVNAPQESLAPQQVGTLEICKTIDNAAGTDPAITAAMNNRVFNFTIDSVTSGPGSAASPIAVQAGFCSSVQSVPTGSTVIRELNTGSTVNGGSFSGGFALMGVQRIGNNNSMSTLDGTNLPARTASVTIAEGATPDTQLSLRFVNRFAVTGFVEICKYPNGIAGEDDAIDPVQGFFNFTIEGVFDTSTNASSTSLQVFTAPVGQCTGAISVTITNPIPTGSPLESTVRVSELGRADSLLTGADTIPADRQVGNVVFGRRVDNTGAVVSNPGGGYITVRVLNTGAAGETVVEFFNTTRPSPFKVCKVAGPGIPVNTLFRFRVRGTGPTADTTVTNPTNGITADNIDTTVDVTAGSLASGGNCQFVPGVGGPFSTTGFQTFLVGTDVRVDELGVSPDNTVPIPNIGAANAEVRVARIASSNPLAPDEGEEGAAPNPDLNPCSGSNGAALACRGDSLGRIEVVATRGTGEVEFTNFLFRPTLLKICKIGTTNAVTGRNFTFNVALNSPSSTGGVNGGGNIFPAFNVPVTVTAGTATNGGGCAFVNGGDLNGGAFNIGSSVTITETAATGAATTLTGVTTPNSPSGTGGAGTGLEGVNLGNRTATLVGANGLVAGVTIVTFTNAPAVAPAPVTTRTMFDFDGDGKADPAVYRGSEGNWYAMGSANGFSGASFGSATDRIVPGDYDGDGKTDLAVVRTVNNSLVWYQMSSKTGTFSGVQFGQAGDIPVPADYSGDGKADVAVFRPSNGGWYILQNGGVTGVQFGQAGDKPVAADYDGDGKADFAVFRPSNGTWYIQQSSAGFTGVQFGQAGDKAVPADYDGDGKTDIAVYRNGAWYMLNSTTGFQAAQFGDGNDIPVPADYDGDRKADIGVYRPSNGTWYMLESTKGFTGVQFGVGTDKPIEAAFLQ